MRVPSPKSLRHEEAERVRAELRRLVEEAGYGGQSKVAESLGVSQQTVGRVVRAESPEPPGVYLARRLADLLNVSVDDLIAGRREPADRSAPLTFGALPGWPEAEAEARQRYPRVPDEAWLGARRMAGWDMGERLRITSDFVRAQARRWEETQEELAALKTEEDVQREIAEDARTDALHEQVGRRKKGR